MTQSIWLQIGNLMIPYESLDEDKVITKLDVKCMKGMENDNSEYIRNIKKEKRFRDNVLSKSRD